MRRKYKTGDKAKAYKKTTDEAKAKWPDNHGTYSERSSTDFEGNPIKILTCKCGCGHSMTENN